MSTQLPLALRWPAHQRFESFLAGANADALEMLRQTARGSDSERVYLAGVNGSGKTHLLVATCAEATAGGRSAQYLDLARLDAAMADTIRRFGGSDLLAIDNVDVTAGSRDAEHALFDLHNRCLAEGSTLVFAAGDLPSALGLTLPDLVSRLSACIQWQLRPLDEAGRRSVLRDRAAARGIELDDPVLDWLFARQARDLGALTRLLEHIDHAALAAQRRVTVPFLRRLLEEPE